MHNCVAGMIDCVMRGTRPRNAALQQKALEKLRAGGYVESKAFTLECRQGDVVTF
jgi:hypothetical protein